MIMTPTLLQSLALASVGIMSPGSMTIVLLLLMSGKQIYNGLAYAVGYVMMYALIGVGVLVFGVEATLPATGQSPTVSFLLIVLGLLLLVLTMRNWRRQKDESKQSSRFSSLLDGITPLKALGIGTVIPFINFKNLAIYLSAVSILLFSPHPLATKLTMLLPVVLIFSTSIITPVLIALLIPNQADHYLTRIKQTLDTYSRPLGLIMPLIIGLLLLYRGLTGLL